MYTSILQETLPVKRPTNIDSISTFCNKTFDTTNKTRSESNRNRNRGNDALKRQTLHIFLIGDDASNVAPSLGTVHVSGSYRCITAVTLPLQGQVKKDCKK